MTAAVPPDRLELVYPAGPPPWDAAPDCAAICVGGRYTKQAVRAYAGVGIEVVTLVDWPMGLGKPAVRQIEAVAAAKDGTHILDLPAPPAPEGGRGDDVAWLRDDLYAVVQTVREVTRSVRLRVVLIDPALTADRDRFSRVCGVVREAGADAVVISGDGLDAESLEGLKRDARPLAVVVRWDAEPPDPVIVSVADRLQWSMR